MIKRILKPNLLQLAVGAGLISCASVACGENILVNGSFEEAVVPIETSTEMPFWGSPGAFLNLTDWTIVSAAGARLANGDLGNGPPYVIGNGVEGQIPFQAAPDGNTFMVCDGGATIIEQVLTAPGPGTITVSYLWNQLYLADTPFASATIELYDGANDQSPTLINDINDIGNSGRQEEWVEYVINSVNNTSSELLIRVVLFDSGPAAFPGIDRIVVDFVGEEVLWGGYPVIEGDGGKWVDTGAWMGWLEITYAPFVWVNSIGGYVYMTEDVAGNESGGWVYLFNFN